MKIVFIGNVNSYSRSSLRYSLLSQFSLLHRQRIEIVCPYPPNYSPHFSVGLIYRISNRVRMNFYELIAIGKLLRYLFQSECLIWIEKGDWVPFIIFKMLGLRNKICVYINDNFSKTHNVGRFYQSKLECTDFLLCVED